MPTVPARRGIATKIEWRSARQHSPDDAIRQAARPQTPGTSGESFASMDHQGCGQNKSISGTAASGLALSALLHGASNRHRISCRQPLCELLHLRRELVHDVFGCTVSRVLALSVIVGSRDRRHIGRPPYFGSAVWLRLEGTR